MWPLDDEIVRWMENVREERREKYGGKDRDDDRDTVPLMSNDYAQGRGK